jgi:hypothetical protein
MNDQSLRRRIAQVAADSSKVLVSPHAKKQMLRRKISRTQVDQVLLKGFVVEHAHLNIKGNWQCTLRCRTGGDDIKVAAALWVDDSSRDWVVVVTAMN